MNSILHSSRPFIKKFVAFFLIGIFTLGITPKKTLHSLLADHTDSSSKTNSGDGEQLNTAGYNCKCDNLVAESNFIASTGFIISVPVSFHSIFSSCYSSFISLPHSFFNLRGPPVKYQL